MKILAIDTSAVASSAAVYEDGKRLSEAFINVKLTHSQTMLPMCNSVLSAIGLTLDDIDAFAVSSGPGSFTGLRIGIAAIKGMALKDNKPCYSVSTLEALAYNLSSFNGTVCAVMDARCNQFYNALFKVSNGIVTRLCEDRAITADELYNELNGIKDEIFIVGDGAELCVNNYSGSSKLTLAPLPLRYASAYSVAAATENLAPISCDELIPIYLRLPQAERERLEREKKESK